MGGPVPSDPMCLHLLAQLLCPHRVCQTAALTATALK